jgi:hypothetical protein
VGQLRNHWIVGLAGAALLAAGLACNAVGGLGNGIEPSATPRPPATRAAPATEAPTEAPEPTDEPTDEPTAEPTDEPTAEPTTEEPTVPPEDTAVPEAGAILFEDDFEADVNGWDVDTNDTAGRLFRDGVYVIQVFNTVWFAWANPETDAFTDVHLRVNVSNVGGNDPAFGVLCGYQDADAFYFLGFGDDGYYGIARIEGNDFILLTGDQNSWVQSDDIELFQDSYDLEADCHADGTLRLIVDGVTIAEARDTAPYGAGGVGLFVQSFDNVPVEVEFDDLVVTRLPE